MRWPRYLLCLSGGFLASVLYAREFPELPGEPTPGDKMLAAYFEAETARLEAASLAAVSDADNWKPESIATRRAQLREMLGLDPLPERTPLKPEVTGSQRFEGIVIENVVFQSRPGLYVTANFYRPAEQDGALPAILYVCGHSGQKADGVSYGNKTGYHHHGVWFAKNGYVCLTIDTIQLGEIEGIHHGTYRYDRWWWNARGYTPAGVEAWNGMRALDYLETRPEANNEKFGITGRSGGGAYSWWVAALDERVKVAVPVAGIASLRNHVVDGCVEGHCDCMYHVNTYRWDFPEVAALVAPRPLLIVNTDKDRIFPLDGVVDVYNKTRLVYEMLGAGENIGLALYEGGHKDTQPLRTSAFHWFERHLKGKALEHEMPDTAAPKVLDRRTLKVLKATPEDEIVTSVDEGFVPVAPAAAVPEDQEQWQKMVKGWESDLANKCFGFPDHRIEQWAWAGGKLWQFELKPQDGFVLPLVIAGPKVKAKRLVLMPVDDAGWAKWSADDFAALRERAGEEDVAYALFAPRGIGPTAWTGDERERVQVRRRFMLIGQTVDSMRVFDITLALVSLQANYRVRVPIDVEAEGVMACNALYASLFTDEIDRLDLSALPASHREGPTYLNVLRILDVPQAVAMAVTRSKVTLRDTDPSHWRYVSETAERLGWKDRFKMIAP